MFKGSWGKVTASLHRRILDEQPKHLLSTDTSDKICNDMQQPSEHANIFQNKGKRGGEWDHPDRTWIGKVKDDEEKIAKIIFLCQAAANENITMPMMTEPCQTFFKQVAMPIKRCLQNHFNNYMSAFLQKHTINGKFPHSKFSKICAGNGSSCVQ